MQDIKKFIVIMIAAALTACAKHREENTDSPAYNHPVNEKGEPVRNPGPDPGSTPGPDPGSSQVKGSGTQPSPPNR